MKKILDIVIVGNGILGVSVAYALAKADPKLKIGIIGPASRNNAATTAAGAMLNCFTEATSLTFSSPMFRQKLTMAVQANKLWESWLESINSDSHLPVLKMNYGTHVILNSHNGGIDDENFLTIQRALKEFNVPYNNVEIKDISGYDPIPDYRALQAIYIPDEAYINPTNVLESLDDIFKNCNHITSIDSYVQTIKLIANGFEITTTDNQKICGEQILLAAGAFTQSLLEQFPEMKAKIPSILSSVGCSLIVNTDIKLNSVIRTPQGVLLVVEFIWFQEQIMLCIWEPLPIFHVIHKKILKCVICLIYKRIFYNNSIAN